MDIVLPFAVRGGQALAEHHTAWKNTGILERSEQTRLASPLRLMGAEGSIEYTMDAKLKGADLVEAQATVLTLADRGALRLTKNSELDVYKRQAVVNASGFSQSICLPAAAASST